jgi:hypothetical protein
MTISALCATGAVDQDFDGPHGLAGPPLNDFPDNIVAFVS